MYRSVRLSLKFLTASKRAKVHKIVRAFQWAVNFYVRSIWLNNGKLDKETLGRLNNTCLTERYKSAALKQALSIVSSTRKSLGKNGKSSKIPIFKGAPVLDAKLVHISDTSISEFDLSVRLSTFVRGKRIELVTKKTKLFNKWSRFDGSQLIQGIRLFRDHIEINYEIPIKPKPEGKILGIDIGICKLLTDSDGNKYGEETRDVIHKVSRAVPGSNGSKRSRTTRNNYVNRVVNSIPWSSISILGIEDIKNLKKGKKKNRSKDFRKMVAPWTYSKLLAKIEQKAEENRVRIVRVNPAYTSSTCPHCNKVSPSNRRGEKYECSCGYRGDADVVGALNILARTRLFLGSLESPNSKEIEIQS